MLQRDKIARPTTFGKRRSAGILLTAAIGGFISAAAVVTPVRAADGCLVLLCLSAPKWRDIPMCVPTMRQVLHDLARGRPFPTCAMSGSGNNAANRWASPPSFCPPQYTHAIEMESGTVYRCDYAGAISVSIDGAPWTRTWWGMDGGTVTEYTPAAKAALGTWDSHFDDDYASWAATLPPPAPPCTSC